MHPVPLCDPKHSVQDTLGSSQLPSPARTAIQRTQHLILQTTSLTLFGRLVASLSKENPCGISSLNCAAHFLFFFFPLQFLSISLFPLFYIPLLPSTCCSDSSHLHCLSTSAYSSLRIWYRYRTPSPNWPAESPPCNPPWAPLYYDVRGQMLLVPCRCLTGCADVYLAHVHEKLWGWLRTPSCSRVSARRCMIHHPWTCTSQDHQAFGTRSTSERRSVELLLCTHMFLSYMRF